MHHCKVIHYCRSHLIHELQGVLIRIRRPRLAIHHTIGTNRKASGTDYRHRRVEAHVGERLKYFTGPETLVLGHIHYNQSASSGNSTILRRKPRRQALDMVAKTPVFWEHAAS